VIVEKRKVAPKRGKWRRKEEGGVKEGLGWNLTRASDNSIVAAVEIVR